MASISPPNLLFICEICYTLVIKGALMKIIRFGLTCVLMLASLTIERHIVNAQQAWPIQPARLVYDHAPTPMSGDIEFLGKLNGIEFFSAFTWDRSRQLWRTDGTQAGTFQLTHTTTGIWPSAQQDVQPESPQLSDFQLSGIIGNNAYFWRQAGAEIELWRSDGSIANTYRFVSEFPETPTIFDETFRGGWFDGFYPVSGAIIAKRIASGSSTEQVELWRIDLATQIAKLIRRVPRSDFPYDIYADGSRLVLFKSFWDNSLARLEISALDPQTGDISPEPSTFQKPATNVTWSSSFKPLLETPAHTVLLIYTRLVTGCGMSDMQPSNGLLVLRPGVVGSTANLALPGLIGIGASASRNGVLYFVACAASGERQLWRTDGTQAGTSFVAPVPAATGCSRIAVFDKNVICLIPSYSEIKWNGLIDTSFSWRQSNSEFMIVDRGDYQLWLNDASITDASSTSTVTQIWRVDGTITGTHVIKQFNVVPSLCPFYQCYYYTPPRQHSLLGNHLVAIWPDDDLRMLDIPSASNAFTPFTRINPGTSDSILLMPPVSPQGYTLYALVTYAPGVKGPGTTTYSLYSIAEGSTTTAQIGSFSSIYAAGIETFRSGFRKLNSNTVVFTANLNTYPPATEILWQTDGTAAGTYPLTETIPVLPPLVTPTLSLFESDGVLYYGANSLSPAIAIQPIPRNAKLLLNEDRLFVIGSTAEYGRELYVIDSPEPDLGVAISALTPATTTGANIQGVIGNGSLHIAITSTLTFTLAPGLTYINDTLGISPTVAANALQWVLPPLQPFERRAFTLRVATPVEPLGTRYALTASIAFSSTDTVSANDTALGEVMIATIVHMPIVAR